MQELPIIPGYLHVSFGDYRDAMLPNANPMATVTGIVTDGDVEEGAIILGAMLMNWGFALGISWCGTLGE